MRELIEDIIPFMLCGLATGFAIGVLLFGIVWLSWTL